MRYEQLNENNLLGVSKLAMKIDAFKSNEGYKCGRLVSTQMCNTLKKAYN